MVDCVTVVEGLSQREKNSILHVLQRDEQLRHGQEQKISNLKREINQIRMCGVLRGGDDQSKMCLRCRGELGILFNRGTLCPSCRFKVCKNCQEVMFNGSWLCKLCYKQRQLKWLTGEWVASFEQNPLRKWASGSDLVKSSMQLVPGTTSIDIDEPSDTHDNAQQGKKVSRNGVGGGRSEENRTRMSVPKEGDQHKLSELFNVLRVKKPEDAPAPSETQVRRVTSRRYSESDSDSSSNSDVDIRSTSTAPSMTESELDGRRIDSPQGMESPPPRVLEPPRVASVDELVKPKVMKNLESSEYRLENGNQQTKPAPRSPKPAARRKVKSEQFENDNAMPSARPRHRDRRERPLPENVDHGHPSMTRSVEESSGRIASDMDRQDNASVHSVELSLHVAKTRESLDKKYEVEKSRSQASLNRVSGYESEQFVRPKSKERIVRKSAESLSKELKHGVNNSDMNVTKVDIYKQDRNSGADVSSVHSGSRSDNSVKSSGSKDTLISNRSVISDLEDKDAVSLKSIPDIKEPSKDLHREEKELMDSMAVPRAGSPYSISMDSLPSSHPSPTNLRHSIGESSNAESSDTDSVSKYGSRPNVILQQGGHSSASRDSGDANDFVVEELSKVHFKRVSKSLGQMGAIAKITRSPNRNHSGDIGLEVEQSQTQSRGADKEEGGGLQLDSSEHFTNKSETAKSSNVLRSVSYDSYGEDNVFAETDSIDDIIDNVGHAQLFVEKTMSAAISEADSDAVWNSTPISPFPQEMYKRRSGKYNRFAFISDDNLDSGDDLLDDYNDDEKNDEVGKDEPEEKFDTTVDCEDCSLEGKENTVTEIFEEKLVGLHPEKKKLQAMGSLDMLLSEQGDVVEGCNDQLGKEYQNALEYVKPEDFDSLEEELESKEIEQSHVRGLKRDLDIVPIESDGTQKLRVELNDSGHKMLARLSSTKPLHGSREQFSEGMSADDMTRKQFATNYTPSKTKLTAQDSLDILIDQQGDFADKDSKNVELDHELLAQLEKQFTEELNAQKSELSLKSKYSYLGVQHNVKDISDVSDLEQPDDFDSLVGDAKHFLEVDNQTQHQIVEKPVLPHIVLLQHQCSPESSESDMLSVIDEMDENSDTSDIVEKPNSDLNVLDDLNDINNKQQLQELYQLNDNLQTASKDVDEGTHDEGNLKGRYKKSKAIEKRVQSHVAGGAFNCQKVVQSKLGDKKTKEKYKKIHDHWLAVERHEADILDDDNDDRYNSEVDNDETKEHDDKNIAFADKSLDGKESTVTEIFEEELVALHPEKKKLQAMGSLDLLLFEQGDVVDDDDVHLSEEYQDALIYSKEGDLDSTEEGLNSKGRIQSHLKSELAPMESAVTENLVADMTNSEHKMLTRLSHTKRLHSNREQLSDGKTTEDVTKKQFVSPSQVKQKLIAKDSLDVLIDQQGDFADKDTQNIALDHDLLAQLERRFTEELIAPYSDVSPKQEYSLLDVQDTLKDRSDNRNLPNNERPDDIDTLVGDAKYYLETDKGNDKQLTEKKSIPPHVALLQHQCSPASYESDMPNVNDEVEKRKSEKLYINCDVSNDTNDTKHKLQPDELHKVNDNLETARSGGEDVAHDEGNLEEKYSETKTIEKKVQILAAGIDFNKQKSVQHEIVDKKSHEKYKKIHDHWLAVERHETDILDIEELDKESNEEIVEKDIELQMKIPETHENVSRLNSKLSLHIPDIGLTDTDGIIRPDVVTDDMKTEGDENLAILGRTTNFEQETFKSESKEDPYDAANSDYSYLGASINDSNNLCHSISDMSTYTELDLHDSIMDSRPRCNSIPDLSVLDNIEEECDTIQYKYADLFSSMSDSDRQCDSIPDKSETEHHDDEERAIKTSNLNASTLHVDLNMPHYQSTEDIRLNEVNNKSNDQQVINDGYSYLGTSINDSSNLCISIRDAENFAATDNSDIAKKEADSAVQKDGKDAKELYEIPLSSLQVQYADLQESISDTRGRCNSISDLSALETLNKDSRATYTSAANIQSHNLPHDRSTDVLKSSAQFRSQIDLQIEQGGKVTPPAVMSDARFFEPPEKPPRLRKETPPSSVPSSPEFMLQHLKEPMDSPRSEKLPGSRDSPQTISECSVSQDDSGHVSGGSRGATPEHKRTDSSYSQSSLPSTLSTVTDEDEDIDRVVANVIKQTSGSRGNLLSIFGDSRESLASYYSDAGDIAYSNVPITGEILFSLNYNYKTSMLEVGIKQCRDIAIADSRRNRSDPYMKTYLLPDRTRGGKRKTKVKKNTTNPTFDETLKYSITKSELENRTLWVTVWHNDRFGRNAFLGEVTINFDYFKFDDPLPKWYPLQERMDAPPQSMMVYKGDLSICIRYVPAEKPGAPSTSTGKQKRVSSRGQLQVMVKEARNLTAVRSNGFSDPFCKGYLLPERHKSSKQKTPVMKKDCNPVWNHTFIFEDVTLMELRERCLELTVWDYEKLTSNDFLGGVRLNLGTGVSQGKGVDWMDARGEEMSMWQAMLDRPNFWIDGALILRPNMDKRKF